jgi:hypothetical protein
MHKGFLLFLFFYLASEIFGQQTVGTFVNLESSFNGYTLIASSASRQTYLIDNCGQIINEWSSNFQPGQSAYLLEDGRLLRTARINGTFNGGGIGGRIEMFSWEGELLWSYDHATPDYHHHHDVEFLPNGNILLLAWERRSRNEALDMGRDPSTVSNAGMWPEQIIEVKPIGTNEVELVWEWHAWDHLVQDFDPSKPNFGVISEHPELLNLNLVTTGGSSPDWIHANSIDYNPVLDQIMFSSRTMSEFFIIDHSTTIEEASSHEGGVYGKGGDFLYRWGNPQNYGNGNIIDQKLYGQHDVHWIPYELQGGGDIMIFNNGIGRPEGSYSTIDVITPPLDQDGSYIREENKAFGPGELTWNYMANPPNSIYGNRTSGAQRMPNGNTLICIGPDGYIFEVDENDDIVWSYENPVNQNGRVSQQSDPGNNSLFRAYRYGTEYPAFENIDLEPGEYLELNSIDYGCQIHSGTSAVTSMLNSLEEIRILSNPVIDVVQIENRKEQNLNLVIYDTNGNTMKTFSSNHINIEFPVSQLPSGVYFLHIINLRTQSLKTEKIIKL